MITANTNNVLLQKIRAIYPIVSIVYKSDVDKAGRFDAEYFKPFNLKAESLITSKNHFRLKNIGEFIIGPFGSTIKVEDYVEEKKYKYIRGKDIKKGVLNDDDNAAVSKEKYQSLPKYHLQDQDVLITVVGTLGNIAIYKNSFGPAIFSCKSTILRPKKISSELLMIFLSTKYGRTLLMRNGRGTIQKGFNLPELENIPIPDFPQPFQLHIENIVKSAHEKQTQSKALYQEAEQILLAELGLVNYQYRNDLWFATTKKEVDEADRFDAEYFQPKYKEIEKKIESYKGGFDKVGNKFLQNKRMSKKDRKFYNYIEIGNINTSNGEINFNKIETSQIPANGKIKLEKNDLLVSKVRPYRGAVGIINFERENLLGSGAFTVLRESHDYKREVLHVFLRLLYIKNYLLKFNVGTSYPVIKDENILNLKIPLIAPKIQEQIAGLVQESHRLREASKERLETAKHKVEQEIERL